MTKTHFMEEGGKMRNIIGEIARAVYDVSGDGEYVMRYRVTDDVGAHTVTITKPGGWTFVIYWMVWQEEGKVNTLTGGAANLDVDGWQAVDALTEWLGVT